MIPDSTSRLLGTVARATGVNVARATTLARAALAVGAPTVDVSPGRSHLNYDGTPLQVCLGTSKKGRSVRVLGDPASHLTDVGARLAASRDALEDVSRRVGGADLASLLRRSLDLSLAPRLEAYTRGVLWLAAGLDGGAALYVDARPWGSDVADAISEWGGAMVADGAELRSTIERLRGSVSFASMGVEGDAPDRARAKVYFRLERAARLTALGLPILGQPAFGRFLARLVGLRRMRLGGLVIALGWSTATGRLADAKVDVCGHCVPREPAQWQAVLDDVAADLGIESPPVESLLRDGSAEVAFVGLGIDVAGQPRLNVYLKPVERAPQKVGRAAARRSLEEGVAALLRLQRPEGRFVEYRLPVGRSDQWVTAYAGVALASATSVPGAREGAERAADWLLRERTYAAGWGYNGRTGPDADSTGFALQLLRRVGRSADEKDRAFLADQWNDGFRTYPRSDAWGHAHPCVTAAAADAWDDELLERRREELVRAMRSQRGRQGSWPSYWWRGPSYATWHHLRLARRLGFAHEGDAMAGLSAPRSAFEMAWTAGIAHAQGDPAAAELLDALVSLQEPDGRWAGSSELRVTDPDCAHPWEDPRGALYTDEDGLMATASAVRVLAEILTEA